MSQNIREVVAIFHDEHSLQDAVAELLLHGFDRSSCSVLAGRHTVERQLGHYFNRIAEIEDDPDVPRFHYMGPDSRVVAMGALASGLAYAGAVGSAGLIIATGGTAAAALLGAALVGGAGGIVGTALSRVISSHHAAYLKEQLDRGGLILWVRADGKEQEALAGEVLRHHAARDVHAHALSPARMTTEGGVSYSLSFMNLLGL